MTAPRIRLLVPEDLPDLARINDAAAPAVPPTSAAELGALAERCTLALVAEDDDGLAGFLLAMGPGLDYASENYRWFSERSTDFVYIDRIVLDSRLRGQGTGRELYQRVFQRGRELGALEATCEVNVQPPNPGSMAFHRRMGFVEVGRQWTKGSTTEVALLAAPLD